ncbi:MAG: hypothetical protein RL556_594 [Actinomycetota bacterium]|jgi:cysteine desulfurase
MIYLDHAATTPVKPEALTAAWPWLTSEFGNPSSQHELGARASSALNQARESVANFIGCRPSEITFTSGGTESNNLSLIGIALANPRGKHIVSAKTEHESVLKCLDFLERIHGFEIDWVTLDEFGQIDLADFESRLRENTTLVTLMLANNEIGTIHPVSQLSAIARNFKIPFHTDAVQAAGWLDLNISELGVSALSLSGHKFGAPKGSGILYCSSRLTLEPLIHGGGQEFERRSGTENVAWAVAIATALDLLEEPEQASKLIAGLRDEFIRAVLAAMPAAKLTGSPFNRQAAIASFVIEGINGETLLLELENEQVICSSGSACAAGSDDPSHVLLALGYDPDLARTSIRFSLGHNTTADELDQAKGALVRAYKKLTA